MEPSDFATRLLNNLDVLLDPLRWLEQQVADWQATLDPADEALIVWACRCPAVTVAELPSQLHLAAHAYDKALALANQAQAQAEEAQRQAALENQKFLDRTSSDIDDSMASGSGGIDNYTVVRGDNLWNISGKSTIYGDPYQWPLIYKANRSQIKDPDLIFPGQNFAIDRNASSSEIDAAINHARTRGAWSVGPLP